MPEIVKKKTRPSGIKTKRDIFEYAQKSIEQLPEESRLIRQAGELIALLNKVVKGYRLYPRNNPMFASFAEEFRIKLETVLDAAPVISYRITPGGFFFGKHQLGNLADDNTISFLLYNDGVRELFFQQGVTFNEVQRLFNILARVTIYTNDDYDIPTLLWEEHFDFIGYITEDELVRSAITGRWIEDDDSSLFREDELSFPYVSHHVDIGLDVDGEGDGTGGPGSGEGGGGEGIGIGVGTGSGGGAGSGHGPGVGGSGGADSESSDSSTGGSGSGGAVFRTWEFNEVSQPISKYLHDMSEPREPINPIEFILTKDESTRFAEILKKCTDSFITDRFMKELSSRMTSGDRKSAEELVDTASMLWEKLVLFGSVRASIGFIRTLGDLAEKFKETSSVFYEKVEAGLSKLGEEEFLDDIFEVLSDIDEAELEYFGEFLALIPHSQLHSLVQRLTNIPDKQIRLVCLNGMSKHMKVTEEFKELLKDSDWKIVRNALTLLKSQTDPQIIPLIRQVINSAEKGTRIEAISLLVNFSAEEALPALEKALKNPDREVRVISLEKVIDINDPRTKIIINRIFQEQYLSTLEPSEVTEYFTAVIDHRRIDLLDLIVAQLYATPQIRRSALDALVKVADLAPVASHLERFISSSVFEKLKKDEVTLFMQLITPVTYRQTLPALRAILNTKSSIFSGGKKEQRIAIVAALAKRRMQPEIIKWFRETMESAPRDTVALIRKYIGA